VSERDRLTDVWRRFRLTPPRIKHVSYVDEPADVPDEVQRQTLVVIGGPAYAKWAVFECPCGRGHRLMLSLQRGHRPCWRLNLDGRGPSLSPSVDSVARWRCHFWLRDGRVHWVREWRFHRRSSLRAP
jgi:hypothetical protein